MIEFHSLISLLTSNDKEYYENWKEHLDLLSISKKKLINLEETFLKSRVEKVKLWENAVGLLDGLSKTTAIEANVLLYNLVVFKLKMQGKGFRKLLSHLFKVATLDKIKSEFE